MGCLSRERCQSMLPFAGPFSFQPVWGLTTYDPETGPPTDVCAWHLFCRLSVRGLLPCLLSARGLCVCLLSACNPSSVNVSGFIMKPTPTNGLRVVSEVSAGCIRPVSLLKD